MDLDPEQNEAAAALFTIALHASQVQIMVECDQMLLTTRLLANSVTLDYSARLATLCVTAIKCI